MPLDYHEPRDQLPPEVLEQHRAVSSLIEELEAVIWYHQRAAVSADAALKAVMEHNRDEEIEHASMLLEWLRRRFPGFDEQLRTYLFTSGELTGLEEAEGAGGGASAPAGGAAGGLNIGSLKEGA
jgi:hypothetical protein